MKTQLTTDYLLKAQKKGFFVKARISLRFKALMALNLKRYNLFQFQI